MGLIAEIGEGPAALDTSAFIYLIEESSDYLPALAPVFAAADAGDIELVTSALTLLEVLVVPLRAADFFLAERYEALLSHSRNLHLVEIDRGQLRSAAQLRASFGVRTPDALQLAAALAMRCPVFVTNDRRLPDVPGLRILQLRDFR